MELRTPAAPLPLLLGLAGLLWSGLMPIQAVGAGAGTPAPADLIQGVKSTRMQIPASRLEMRVSYKNATQAGEWDLTSEFDADKYRVFQTKPHPAIRTLFDGAQIIQHDSNQRVVFRDIRDQPGDLFFHPHLLGIATMEVSGQTLDDVLPTRNATAFQTLGHEQINDTKAWHIQYVNTNEYDLTIDVWIDEKNDFRVYRYDYSILGNKPSTVLSFYENQRYPYLPSRIQIRRYYDKVGQTEEILEIEILKAEAGVKLPANTWTIAGVQPPIGAVVEDRRLMKFIGYWDGEQISPNPVTARPGRQIGPLGQGMLILAALVLPLLGFVYLKWHRKRTKAT